MDCNLYIHGGGTRLAAHFGALKCLQEHGIHVRSWAGTSAGSVVSSLLVAGGYSLPEAIEIMFETNYKQFLDVRPFRIFHTLGMCAGKAFEKWMDGKLRGARFRSLDTPLAVVAADICTGRAQIFSHDETPDVKVATAVRCSIGIPGIFGVRKMKEGTFVDGSLAPVEPEQLFPDLDRTSMLIRLKPDLTTDFAYRKKFRPISYMRRIVEMMFRCADDLCFPERFTYDLNLEVGTGAAFAFDMAGDVKDDLLKRGYESCRSHFVDRLLAQIDEDQRRTGEPIVSDDLPTPESHLSSAFELSNTSA